MSETIREYRPRYNGGPAGNLISYENLVCRDTALSRPLNGSPWDTCPQFAFNDPGLGWSVYDEMVCNNASKTLDIWQQIKNTGGTITVNATAGGWVGIPTAASANDYNVFASQAAMYALAANKPIWYEIGINVTEANTNESSWFVGLSSVTTTGFLSNAGAVPSSYSGAVFWKPKGAMAVNFGVSNGTTQSSTAPLFTAVSGTTYWLGCYLNPNDGTTAIVTPYAAYLSGGVYTLITPVGGGTSLNLAIASLANMYFQFGIRAGSSSAETLNVDFVQTCAFR